MANKNIATRIKNKYDLKENWDKAVNFIPLSGELITVAPNTQVTEPETVFKNVPHRIKIGDGIHSIQELPYIGMPTIKVAETKLTGFNSITLFPSGNVNLQLCLGQEDTKNISNFEQQEYLHHRIFAQTNRSANNKFIEISLNIIGDGREVNTGIKASDVDIYFMPSKCLLDSWHTGNTVSNEQYSSLDYAVAEFSNITSGLLTYNLTLPEDKDNNGAYLFDRGTFQIDISCFLSRSTSGTTTVSMFIENAYLAPCHKYLEEIVV